MRYLVRQKIFSFGDNFAIKNEEGYECFYVRGKVFSLGDKLRIEDALGNEVAYIEQQLFRFLPEYYIYTGGQVSAVVKKEFTFFKPKFTIESSLGRYEIDGEIFSHDFQIVKDGYIVATVSKQWFSFSDTYGVEISENEDQGFMLALVIVIDQVLHDNNKR
ncbi:MAG: LURP-one-related/scramblase family protein [Bacillota bacterium]